MIDKKYGQLMTSFVDNLPETNVVIVYFRTSEPHILNKLRILSIANKRLFINRGPVGLWVYTYFPTAIQYLFTRIDTKVQAFVGTVLGGAGFEIGSVGSHLSVGIKEKTNRLMLNTHFTFYEEEADSSFHFNEDRSTECTLWLDEELDDNSVCISQKGHPLNKLFGSVYKDYPIVTQVINTLRSVFLGDIEISQGTKGGRYITGLNGLKRYVRPQKNIHGGSPGKPLTNDIIDMIYKHVVKPTADICSRDYNYGISPSLLYDTDNTFECTTQQIVLLYDIPHQRSRRVFYLEAEKVFAAYEAYKYDQAQANITVNPPIRMAPPSQQARSCLNHFKEMVSMQAHVMMT